MSIASTLTTGSASLDPNHSNRLIEHDEKSNKSLTEEEEYRNQLEQMPEWIKNDAHVIVSTNTVQNKRGFVRYIGPTKFARGLWIGVELEQKFGKNDGSVKGHRYFTCPEEKGVFVRADKLSLVLNRLLE